MSTFVHKVGSVIQVAHEPGNGTRYLAMGALVPNDFESGEGWIITFLSPEHVGYFFKKGGFTHVGYVAEKWPSVSEVDVHEMTKCISLITGGLNNATTDKTGRLPLLRIAP